MSKRKSKAQRAHEEKVYARLNECEAKAKRAKARLTRAFNAWVKADSALARAIKAIEKPPKEKGPGGEYDWTEAPLGESRQAKAMMANVLREGWEL